MIVYNEKNRGGRRTMFFFYGASPILIAAAIIPAIVLMLYVYRADRLEREPAGLLFSLVLLGIISTSIAKVLERLGGVILGRLFSQNAPLYNVLLFFVVVGCSEEGAKYFLLRRRTWDSPHFNCQFDAVLYAVFVSLGFALWENIGYVLMYGFQTAVARALTAIPGHACFGVFMGAWYGLAKRHALRGEEEKSKAARILAVVLPVFLHGTYDYLAAVEMQRSAWIFVVFVGLMFLAAFVLVRRMSRNDRYLV